MSKKGTMASRYSKIRALVVQQLMGLRLRLSDVPKSKRDVLVLVGIITCTASIWFSQINDMWMEEWFWGNVPAHSSLEILGAAAE